MLTKTLATVVALAALSFAAGGHAGLPDTVSTKVRIGDLNLASEAGDKAALRRIHQAAKAICGDDPDVRVLDGGVQYRACMTSVTERAVALLCNPDVTAIAGGSSRGDTVLASNPR